MKITINGASDDLMEVEGCVGADEFPADVTGRWQGDLIAPDGTRMRVHCWYDGHGGGCWQVGIGQTSEDHTLPAWPIAITQLPAEGVPGYSALLSIDAPDGTRLANVKPGQGD